MEWQYFAKRLLMLDVRSPYQGIVLPCNNYIVQPNFRDDNLKDHIC